MAGISVLPAYGSHATPNEDPLERASEASESIGAEGKRVAQPPAYEETLSNDAANDDAAEDNGSEPLLQRPLSQPAETFDVEDPAAKQKQSWGGIDTKFTKLRQMLREKYPAPVADILAFAIMLIYSVIIIGLILLATGFMLFLFIGWLAGIAKVVVWMGKIWETWLALEPGAT